MLQQSIGSTPDANTETGETGSFIKQAKRITHSKLAPEEKIRIVLESLRHEVSIWNLCREGIRPNV